MEANIYWERQKEIGNLIRNWRINEGLTRNELCTAAGVHHNSIRRDEAGEKMTVLNLMKIADGLQTEFYTSINIIDHQLGFFIYKKSRCSYIPLAQYVTAGQKKGNIY